MPHGREAGTQTPMRSILGYLSNYSAQFWFSVIAGLFTSLVLTVPIAAILYHRRGRLRVLTVLGIYLSILYAFALVFFTLFPIPEDPKAFCAAHRLSPNLDPLQFLSDFRESPRATVFQTGFNVVFFLPLGFSLRRLFRWRPWAVVVGGFCASLLIECSQLTGVFGIFPCAYRLFDVDDLITNTLGAILGLLIALAVDRISPPKPADRSVVRNPGIVRRLVAFSIDGLLTASLAWLATVVVSMVVALAAGGTIGTAQLRGSDRLSSPASMALLVLSLALFQWLIPWKSDGRTLAGRYVHMSIETRPRTGSRRFWFYAVRFVVIAVLFLWHGPNVLLAVALLVFYAVKRQMLYDLLPSDSASSRASDPGAASAASSSAPANAAVPPNPDPAAGRTRATDGSTRNPGSPADPTA